MKTFKVSVLMLMTLFFCGATASSLDAGEHNQRYYHSSYNQRHYHKHKHKHSSKSSFSSFFLNLNLFDSPRYVEHETVVTTVPVAAPVYVQQVAAPVCVQPQVLYTAPAYHNTVIVERSVPVMRQQVYYHPHYSYWRY